VSSVDAPAKDRVVAYLDPEVARRIRVEHAETRRTISDVLNEIVRGHYAAADRARPRPPRPR
jgi:hypothetical protein